jgi:hypothetical protein
MGPEGVVASTDEFVINLVVRTTLWSSDQDSTV